MRFGRPGKRFEESSNTRILRAVESLSGKQLDAALLAGLRVDLAAAVSPPASRA